MKKFWFILIIVSFFGISACQDDDNDGRVMQFVETQCDNPWEILPGPENYLVEVRKYLEDSGIKVISIFFEVYDEDLGANCNACNCATGRNIIIRVLPMDIDEAKALGFTLIE